MDRKIFGKCDAKKFAAFIKNIDNDKSFVLRAHNSADEKVFQDRYTYACEGQRLSVVYETKAQTLIVTSAPNVIDKVCRLFFADHDVNDPLDHNRNYAQQPKHTGKESHSGQSKEQQLGQAGKESKNEQNRERQLEQAGKESSNGQGKEQKRTESKKSSQVAADHNMPIFDRENVQQLGQVSKESSNAQNKEQQLGQAVKEKQNGQGKEQQSKQTGKESVKGQEQKLGQASKGSSNGQNKAQQPNQTDQAQKPQQPSEVSSNRQSSEQKSKQTGKEQQRSVSERNVQTEQTTQIVDRGNHQQPKQPSKEKQNQQAVKEKQNGQNKEQQPKQPNKESNNGQGKEQKRTENKKSSQVAADHNMPIFDRENVQQLGQTGKVSSNGQNKEQQLKQVSKESSNAQNKEQQSKQAVKENKDGQGKTQQSKQTVKEKQNGQLKGGKRSGSEQSTQAKTAQTSKERKRRQESGGFEIKNVTNDKIKELFKKMRAAKIKYKTISRGGLKIFTVTSQNQKAKLEFVDGTLKLTGDSGNLYSELQIMISQVSDYKTAIDSHIKSVKEDKRASEVERQLKKKLPSAFEFLSEQSKIDLAIAVIDINNSAVVLSDYSTLLIPCFRGLERLIFDLQHAQGIVVKMIGQAYEKEDGNYVLKTGYRRRIPSVIYAEVMASLYTEYFKQRNFYAHSDGGYDNMSRIISDKQQVITIFNHILDVINYNGKKLKEIGFRI